MTDYTHDIERYLSGKMTPAEMNALEKRALSDPFLADALEGALQIPTVEFSEDTELLNKKITAQSLATRNTAGIWRWSARIAAGLVLVAISAFIIWKLTDTSTEPQQLALEQAASPPASEGPTTADSTAPSVMLESLSKAPSVKADSRTREIASAYEGPKEKPKVIVGTEVIVESETADQPADEQAEIILEESKAVEDVVLKEAVPTEAVVELGNAEGAKLAKKDAYADDEKRKGVARATAPAVQKNSNQIQGKVTSAEDGSALPGVNVVIKGTTIGTVTDAQGNYLIEPATSNSTLVYSYIGLQSQEVNTGNKNEVDVQMTLDVSQLSEVVVTAQGVERSKAAGYAGGEPSETIELAHPSTGNQAFKKYLESNIQYPQEALAKKVEGRVTVEFFVEPDGALTGFTIVRGVGSGCNEELIRLIQEGPKWIPTKKNAVSVLDKARVSLRFVLPKK